LPRLEWALASAASGALARVPAVNASIDVDALHAAAIEPLA
jgi:hypothetical protein